MQTHFILDIEKRPCLNMNNYLANLNCLSKYQLQKYTNKKMDGKANKLLSNGYK